MKTVLHSTPPEPSQNRPATVNGTHAVLAYQDIVVIQPDNGGGLEAFDPQTGKRLWEHAGPVNDMLADSGVLYILGGGELGALNLADGKAIWTIKADPATLGQSRFDMVISGVLVANSAWKLWALSAADGKLLWEVDKPKPPPNNPYVHPCVHPWHEKVAWMTVVFDPTTGQPAGSSPAITGTGCYWPLFLPDMIVHGKARVHSDGPTVIIPTRGTCAVNCIAANGLLYGCPEECGCGGADLINHVALGRQGRIVAEADFTGPRPVERGEASPGDREVTSPWPTYRGDPTRSAAVKCEPVRHPVKLWSATPGYTAAKAMLADSWGSGLDNGVTAPVIAGDMVIVSHVDTHQVVALSAADGKPRWRFRAGGRVDSPPTIAGARCVFGCRDGWVYCLGTVDGRLLWRARAAPVEQFVPTLGQFESRWPVKGSLAVQDGVVYACAGRTCAADRGMALCAFDLADGSLLWAKAADNNPARIFRNDIMVASDGGMLWLGDAPLLDAQKLGLKGNWFNAPRLVSTSRAGLANATQTFTLPGYHGEWTIVHKFAGVRARQLAWTPSLVCGWARSTGIVLGGCPSQAFRTWPNDLFAIDRASQPQPGSTNTPVTAYELWKEVLRTQQPYEYWAETLRQGRLLHPSTNATPQPADLPNLWRVKLPQDVQVHAIVLAGDVMVTAESMGPPDARKGQIRTTSLAHGEALATVPLGGIPAYNGLAAADRRIYVSLLDGSVHAFAERPDGSRK